MGIRSGHGRSVAGLATAGVAVLLLGTATVAVRAGGAVQGVAPPRPYPEAVQLSRQAAEAVLGRRGTEGCLRGKLTRALLVLSSSCASQGLQTELCGLADRAVVVPVWSLPFLETTAQQLLAALAEG